MTPDDITRLAADISEVSCAVDQRRDPVASAAWKRVRAAIAQQGNAGGVAEGWQPVPRVLTIEMHIAFCEAWFSRRRPIDDSDMQDAWDAALAAAPQPPAHSPDAGVTDEMVERALAEWFSDENSRDDGPETSWAAVQKEYADGGNWLRESMGKALTAALAPQPKDAER